MDNIVDRLLQLGGRNISERCATSIVSTIMYMTGIKGLDEKSKSRLLVFFKVDYKRRGRRAAIREPYLQDLPMPQDLMQQWPDLYKSVFGDQHPVPSRIGSSITPLTNVYCKSSRKTVQEMLRLEKH